jgi:hypothetical protein
VVASVDTFLQIPVTICLIECHAVMPCWPDAVTGICSSLIVDDRDLATGGIYVILKSH